MSAPFVPAGWATHDANGNPLFYPGPDGTLYLHGYPATYLEVHEHASLTTGKTVRHSHENPMAAHKGRGPAAFDVCAECWRRSTGLKGGGQKRYTKRPTGVQL
jgi:hypothetical protein